MSTKKPNEDTEPTHQDSVEAETLDIETSDFETSDSETSDSAADDERLSSDEQLDQQLDELPQSDRSQNKSSEGNSPSNLDQQMSGPKENEFGDADDPTQSEASYQLCPSCQESCPSDAAWCEACGQVLDVDERSQCVKCEQPIHSNDGYCDECGHKQPGERDHLEDQIGRVAAVTDKGKRHRENEDAFAIDYFEQNDISIAVVCDGVTSTPGSAEVSIAAATTAKSSLRESLGGIATNKGGTRPSFADESVVTDALLNAAATAQNESKRVYSEVNVKAPPSSTFVAAVIERNDLQIRVTVAWLGDSRLYWLGEQPQLLTEDHEIEGSLSRWIGADSPTPSPQIASFDFNGPGSFVACSDGLWRYATSPDAMAALLIDINTAIPERAASDVEEGSGGLAATELSSTHHADKNLIIAQGLVRFANLKGGHDNITAAVWNDLW